MVSKRSASLSRTALPFQNVPFAYNFVQAFSGRAYIVIPIDK